MFRAFIGSLSSLLCIIACAPSAEADEEKASQSWGDALGAEIEAPWDAPQHREFDFWRGESQMNWRNKPAEEFYHVKEGNWTRGRVFPILGGKALVELAWDRDKPDEASQRGFSIRYYDETNERWVMAQNWPNAASQGAAFMDQLVGKKHHGRLTMYSITQRPDAEGNIQTEHRRYNFADIRDEGFRWDGSNTRDEGATWYTWAIVDAHKLRPLDPFGAAGSAWPGVHQESLCTDEPHGAFDGLQGVWTGTATGADGAASPATLTAGRVLDGCGVVSVLETDAGRTFMATGYSTRFERWVTYRLDDKPGTGHSYLVSETAGEGAVFAEAPALVIQDEFTPYLSTAAFNTDGAMSRTVVEKMTETELTLRREVRGSDQDAWRAETRIMLQRNE